MSNIPLPRASNENHGGDGGDDSRLTTLFQRWAQSTAATATVIGVALVLTTGAAIALGALAVYTLGSIPGLGLTLLIAAAGLGPGVMWIDKKLTP